MISLLDVTVVNAVSPAHALTQNIVIPQQTQGNLTAGCWVSWFCSRTPTHSVFLQPGASSRNSWDALLYQDTSILLPSKLPMLTQRKPAWQTAYKTQKCKGWSAHHTLLGARISKEQWTEPPTSSSGAQNTWVYTTVTSEWPWVQAHHFLLQI